MSLSSKWFYLRDSSYQPLPLFFLIKLRSASLVPTHDGTCCTWRSEDNVSALYFPFKWAPGSELRSSCLRSKHLHWPSWPFKQASKHTEKGGACLQSRCQGDGDRKVKLKFYFQSWRDGSTVNSAAVHPEDPKAFPAPKEVASKSPVTSAPEGLTPPLWPPWASVHKWHNPHAHIHIKENTQL